MARFGEAIKQARQRLKVSQEWVGGQAGIGQSMVAQVEGGTREPSIDIAADMVSALIGRALGGEVKALRLLGSSDGRPEYLVEFEVAGRRYGRRMTGPQPVIETLGLRGSLRVSRRVELMLLAEVLTLATEAAEE